MHKNHNIASFRLNYFKGTWIW